MSGTNRTRRAPRQPDFARNPGSFLDLMFPLIKSGTAPGMSELGKAIVAKDYDRVQRNINPTTIRTLETSIRCSPFYLAGRYGKRQIEGLFVSETPGFPELRELVCGRMHSVMDAQ